MSQNAESKQLIRGTSIVAVLTIVSRFFGFIRDLLVARLFGASLIADCFFIAFRIPNLLRSFVAEGALSAAFVPIFTSELKNGKASAQNVLSLVTGFLTFITSIMTVLGIIYAEELLTLIAPGFMQPESAALCIKLTQIMMPYIICISLVAMLNGALNSVNIFGIAALAQVVMNLVLIVGAVIAGYLDDQSGVMVLAYSVVAGGIAQVIIQIPALAKAGLHFKPKFNLLSPAIKSLVGLMLPAILGATVYQISQFINTLLASLLTTGSVSWLFYADRITQLPIGIFSIALASVLLPALSKAASDKNHESFSKQLIDSLRYTSFFVIPISGTIFIFAEPITVILFERGEFTRIDSYNTALAIKAFAIGLWAVSSHSMLARAFIAKKDTVTPTLVGIVVLATSLILALSFMGHISSTSGISSVTLISQIQAWLGQFLFSTDLGHAGLALASSLAAFIGLILLSTILKFRNKDITWNGFIKASWKAVAATLTAGYLCYELQLNSHMNILGLTIGCSAFSLIFVLISLLLGSLEMKQTLFLFKEKILKK